MVTLAAILSLSAGLPRRKHRIIASNVDKEKETVEINDEQAFGSCPCDLTRGSCDAYCCCDSDCSDAVLKVWQERKDFYCANNFYEKALAPE